MTTPSEAEVTVFANFAKTQVLSITQMLNFGIRHLDVRLQHDGDTFDVIHGEYDMGSTYREFVAECYFF